MPAGKPATEAPVAPPPIVYAKLVAATFSQTVCDAAPDAKAIVGVGFTVIV